MLRISKVQNVLLCGIITDNIEIPHSSSENCGTINEEIIECLSVSVYGLSHLQAHNVSSILTYPHAIKSH